ncbi:hypothetical protein HDU85_004261 [Gaertneriomyces sp. JEL0708]|nr:hypothetical protein HDU85_004261 [Gaertneriomyces sp. JEL0708]
MAATSEPESKMSTLKRKMSTLRRKPTKANDKEVEKQPDLSDVAGGDYFTTKDGSDVYYKIWKPTADPVAALLAIHGVGEHCNRYNDMFSAFAAEGIVVRALDLRGHGRTHFKNVENGSIQGYLNGFKSIFEDLLQLNSLVIDGLPAAGELPTFVFGHSMGGLLALALVNEHADRIPNFRGVVAQAPCIRTTRTFPAAVLNLIKFLSPLAYKLQAAPGPLRPEHILDEEFHENFLSDPWRHNFMTLRTLRDFIVYGRKLERGAAHFAWPVLIYHAQGDVLTDCNASEKFIKDAASTDKTLRLFVNAKHELHYCSSIRAEVTSEYTAWILKRATAVPPTPPKTGSEPPKDPVVVISVISPEVSACKLKSPETTVVEEEVPAPTPKEKEHADQPPPVEKDEQPPMPLEKDELPPAPVEKGPVSESAEAPPAVPTK